MIVAGGARNVAAAKRKGESLGCAAGALLRISDDMSDYARPWRFGGPYGPRKFGDRWPSTFINSRHAGTYGNGWGIVIDPRYVTIKCGYAADGRSMDKSCEPWSGASCVAGCTPQTAWCSAADASAKTSCAWRPEQLDLLLRQADATNPWGHNEVVLDPHSLVAKLPHSVMAVFFQDQNVDDARSAHRAFLSDYSALTAKEFPLLHYHADNGRPHFECVQCS